MAATENFLAPSWTNPIDEDLDDIRDTANFLLGQALAGADFAPGWQTITTIVTGINYTQPDGFIHTRGTRKFTINLTWT